MQLARYYELLKLRDGPTLVFKRRCLGISGGQETMGPALSRARVKPFAIAGGTPAEKGDRLHRIVIDAVNSRTVNHLPCSYQRILSLQSTARAAAKEDDAVLLGLHVEGTRMSHQIVW